MKVKAATTINQNDLRGLKRLAKIAGKPLKMGVILYDGRHGNLATRNQTLGSAHFGAVGEITR